MSNTFNFKRFWKYFTYDLISAKNNTGLSLAIAGAAPVFTYAIYQIFALLFDGKTAYMPSGVKIAAIVIAVFISILYFPTKQYGSLTDKRAGADWLMLPASRLEKWFSLLLITCLVVPAFLFVELFATDKLLSLIFNGTYGASAFSQINRSVGLLWNEFTIEGVGKLAISAPYALYLSFCQNILFFTLGTIYFKKSKIGMTFLSSFVITIALSMLLIAVGKIFSNFDFNLVPEDISDEAAMRTMNIIIYSIYIVVFGVLDILLYLRIKSLKH